MSYVAAGYGVTLMALGSYAGWIVRRRRSLARLVGPRREVGGGG